MLGCAVSEKEKKCKKIPYQAVSSNFFPSPKNNKNIKKHKFYLNSSVHGIGNFQKKNRYRHPDKQPDILVLLIYIDGYIAIIIIINNRKQQKN